MRNRTAIYTVAYPAAAGFLRDWYTSVENQTLRPADVWMSLDGMTPADVEQAIGKRPSARMLQHTAGSSPARIRREALCVLAGQCDAVILADSDDMLEPQRVETALQDLENADLAACGLRLVDRQGHSQGILFGPGDTPVDAAFLSRWNVFGLSNTAWRTDLLRRCLPFDDGCCLIDWLLATRAMSYDARITFNPEPLMAYRQYEANTAPVTGPFTPAGVSTAAGRVLGHYRRALSEGGFLSPPLVRQLTAARSRLLRFLEWAHGSPVRLKVYTAALNALPVRGVWWWCVANPELEHIWNR